jgi:hypothetical protein
VKVVAMHPVLVLEAARAIEADDVSPVRSGMWF